MNRALWFLARRSAVNAIARALDVVRRPSRLLGLVVGVAYLGWLSRHTGAATAPDPRHATLLGAIGLLVLTAAAWILGTVGQRGGSEPSRVLLFPAPVSDASLVVFSLVAAQALVLPNVALWTLLGSRGAEPLVVLQRAAGLWLLFTIVMCHRALVARVRGSEFGPRWLRRSATLLGLMLLACMPFVLTGTFDLSGGGWRDLSPTGPGKALLAPFELPVRPVTATGGGWAGAALASALLLAGHVLLLLLLGPSREPPHVATREVGPALPLPARGTTQLAAWKAVTASLRRVDVLRLVAAAVIAAALLRALHAWGSGAGAEFAGFLALTWSPLVLVLGAQFLRSGLRRDASRVALLRTLPLRGRSLVLGGALGGGGATALLAGLLLLVGLAGAGASEELLLPVDARLAALAAAGFLMVPVAMLATLIQDGLFLFFPGPLSLGTPQAGATRLGTTLVNSVLSVALLALLLFFPVAAAIWMAAMVPWPLPLCIVAGALLAAALMLAEALLLSSWLGARLEQSGASA